MIKKGLILLLLLGLQGCIGTVKLANNNGNETVPNNISTAKTLNSQTEIREKEELK